MRLWEITGLNHMVADRSSDLNQVSTRIRIKHLESVLIHCACPSLYVTVARDFEVMKVTVTVGQQNMFKG